MGCGREQVHHLLACGVDRAADGLGHPPRSPPAPMSWRRALVRRPARPARPITASTATAPGTTRQIVAVDGQQPPRPYSSPSSSAGTSTTQPAIAVNEHIPATTAAAHSASTTATG